MGQCKWPGCESEKILNFKRVFCATHTTYWSLQNRKRVCVVDGCDKKEYAITYCKKHYEQKRRGVDPHESHVDMTPRPCEFETCNRPVEIWKSGLCSAHNQQLTQGKELKPLVVALWTETGRICRVCGEDKPLDQYYVKNVHLGRPTPAGTCKSCTIKKQLEWHRRKRAI